MNLVARVALPLDLRLARRAPFAPHVHAHVQQNGAYLIRALGKGWHRCKRRRGGKELFSCHLANYIIYATDQSVEMGAPFLPKLLHGLTTNRQAMVGRCGPSFTLKGFGSSSFANTHVTVFESFDSGR